jgi:cell division protein FtsI (penicillin-binding protein 3)
MPPRIIKSTIAPDGTRTDEPRPEGVRVVTPETARTVRNMFRAIVQRDPMGAQQGTGPQAAGEGYQIAGKTGTAQQINPACGCYYDDVYWITFAGMAPADDPRYVVGIMMDAPHRAADGSPGSSAAPLFHNIASWLLQRHNVPLSADPGPRLTLQAT